MKKPALAIIAIMAFTLVFSSCRKEYSCSCTRNGGAVVFKFEYGKKSKKEAKAECHAKDEELGPNYKCEVYPMPRR